MLSAAVAAQEPALILGRELPPELLREIFEHLLRQARPSALLSVLRVNRQWFQVGCQVLWAFPRLPPTVAAPGWIRFVDLLKSPLESHCQHYRDSIQHMYDLWLYRMSEQDYQRVVESREESREEVKVVAQSAEHAKNQRERYSLHSVLAFAMEHCPRLKKFHLSLNSWPDTERYLTLPWAMGMQKLTVLVLENALIADAELQQILGTCSEPRFPLQELCCRICWVSDRSLELLARKCPLLRVLRLRLDPERAERRRSESMFSIPETGNAPWNDGPSEQGGLVPLLDALKYLQQVHIYPLSKLQVSPGILPSLLGNNPELTSVTLSVDHCSGTTSSMVSLDGHNCSIYVGLSWNSISEYLDQATCPKLRSITFHAAHMRTQPATSVQRRRPVFQHPPANHWMGDLADGVISEDFLLQLPAQCPTIRELCVSSRLNFELRANGPNMFTTRVDSGGAWRGELDNFLMRFKAVYGDKVHLSIVDA